MKEYKAVSKDLIKGRWYRLRFNPLKEKLDLEGIKRRGNYVFFINGTLRYIGESKNLAKRINTHAANMVKYFPNKNARVVFKVRLERNPVEVERFIETERRVVERRLISRLNPAGNGGNNGEIADVDIFFTKDEFLCMKQWIKKELCKYILTGDEVKILKMRFGLMDDKIRYSLQEIGNQLGITRERVRQREMRAIERLRNYRKINFNKIDINERVENLGLSERCANCLDSYGLYTLKELREFCNRYGTERLFIIRGFGTKSRGEVEELLRKTSNV